jgi:hypothetical protein
MTTTATTTTTATNNPNKKPNQKQARATLQCHNGVCIPTQQAAQKKNIGRRENQKIWTRRIFKEDSKKNPSDPRAEEGATEFRPEQVELGFFFGCGLQWRRRRRRVVIVRCALLCSVHG